VATTLIVAVIAEVPLLTAVKDATLPVPPEPNPIEVFELVHVNVPPAGMLEKLVEVTVPPLHAVRFDGTVAVGVGFTVTVRIKVAPVQLPALGVMV